MPEQKLTGKIVINSNAKTKVQEQRIALEKHQNGARLRCHLTILAGRYLTEINERLRLRISIQYPIITNITDYVYYLRSTVVNIDTTLTKVQAPLEASFLMRSHTYNQY